MEIDVKIARCRKPKSRTEWQHVLPDVHLEVAVAINEPATHLGRGRRWYHEVGMVDTQIRATVPVHINRQRDSAGKSKHDICLDGGVLLAVAIQVEGPYSAPTVICAEIIDAITVPVGHHRDIVWPAHEKRPFAQSGASRRSSHIGWVGIGMGCDRD